MGETGFKVKVTSGSFTQTYTATVERDSSQIYGWMPTRDFNTLAAAGNADAAGMWGNATTVWVVNTGDDKLYAYYKATMARDAPKDINLDTENSDPWGIWSDDTTIWVSDTEDAKLYAYTLANGMRVSETGGGPTTYPKDVALDAANPYPRGIWSNNTTNLGGE